MQMRFGARAVGAALPLVIASGALGGLIPFGCFQLNNHPDGSWRPPNYGLILTELYNVNSSKKDYFTFDFDHEKSDVQLCWDGECIVIQGKVYGGRDVGDNWANDTYKGVYEVYFKYTNVANFPGDDDLYVKNEGAEGWIKTTKGHTKSLASKSDGSYAFRLGDESDDAGHREFPGISGWGWLKYGATGEHHSPSDWLFTVKIPSPGSLALMMAALPFVAIRRRR